MTATTIKVDSSKALVALGRFQLSIRENEELLTLIGLAMLVSVRRTFREQGVPANSWVPLAASTVKRDPKRYGSGHKLLIGKGTLLNSITYRVYSGGVAIGTNLKYAPVHQFGSRDRGGVIGPQARIPGRDVQVGAHSYVSTRRNKAGDKFGVVNAQTKDGFKIKGRRRQLISGVSFAPRSVRAHGRFQNIPARPYLVIRPEDPGRIQTIVRNFVSKKKAEAGLGGGQ
jgi:phage gpG-like protein